MILFHLLPNGFGQSALELYYPKNHLPKTTLP